MKRLLSLVAFFATLQASAQQVNPVPDYVFRNQMSVGRGTVTDTAAYFSIGPRYGANKGFMPPIVGDTATFSSGKRNGLLIFSVQKNKFLYWDSVRVQWSDMAGSSGTYITGTGITGYVPQFSGTTTIDTSGLFTLGSRLGIGTTSFAYNSTSTANVELNGTAGGILGFKRNDSARGYLWHTGDNMELANTTAGAISFNTNSATRGSISSAGVWRLHNLAGTGDRVVVASSNGTLSASTSVTGLVDTTTISTRAWRQKGDDSLGAIIATKGSGTVTSVATGFGLSGGTITTTGTLLVDTLNIATRAWRQKGLDSLAALEVSGSGTTNYIPKFTASSTIGNSQIFDNGTNVGIGTASPTLKFQVIGDIASSTRVVTDLINGYNGGSTPLTIQTGGAQNLIFGTNNTERLRIFANGRIGVNTTTDAGYQFDINGTLRSVNGANFATTSGNVGIGTASPSDFVHIQKNQNASTTLQIENTDTTSSSARANLIVKNGPVQYAVTAIGKTGEFLNAAYAGTGSSHPLYLTTNGAARQTIFPNGRVFVGASPTDAGYQFDINGTLRSVNGANFATTSGNVGIGTASPASILHLRASSATFTIDDSGDGTSKISFRPSAASYAERAFMSVDYGTAEMRIAAGASGGAYFQSFYTNGTERARYNSAGELLINTTTDAGDYKLQVVGNARVGTGKLDIASNTTYGLGIARSGTSEIAGQIYNSNGILYTGVESSAGGGIFTGSSAYAAVIGSGANYPLQFATNNATRATINTNGELLINTLSDQGDYKLQVNGSVYNTGQVTRGHFSVIGTNAQLLVDSTTNLTPFYGRQFLTGTDISAFFGGVVGWNTSGNVNGIDLYINNTSSGSNSNYMQLGDGTNYFKVTKDAGIITANPTSGTARKWKLGSVVATSVQLDTSNYVEVEINGTFYRLAIVTPL